MKGIISLTRLGLLQDFIAQHLSNCTVLITENILSDSEITARSADLDSLCDTIENLTHTPLSTSQLIASEYLVFHVDRLTAYAICNQFSRSVLPLYVFHDGTYVYQNK